MKDFSVILAVDPLETANNIVISEDLIRLFLGVVCAIVLYFFSYSFQKVLAKITHNISRTIGVYSNTKEYQFQRYVYQHSKSPFSKLYKWINLQIIALGIKRQGVTVMGYLLFWGFMAIIVSLVINIVAGFGLFFTFPLWLLCFIAELVVTRVVVSERMERREADVMNAIDLIVPEVGNGVKNAIITYKDNFAPSLREDFMAFVTNIQDRGYTFEDAMYILTDNLGPVFQDFAQKAIYYEAIGEKEMVDIFNDLTETNRLRRQLRDENSAAFAGLKMQFVVSVIMVFGYFCFIILTDEFSRYFFLTTTTGKVLLLCILIVVFAVLSYISTIKSRTI